MSEVKRVRVEWGKRSFEGEPVSWPPIEKRKFQVKGEPTPGIKHSLGTLLESLPLASVKRNKKVWTCTEKNGETFKVTEVKEKKS